MLRMVCAPTGGRGNSTDHSVLVHVQDIEVGVAVGEIQLDGTARLRRSVGDCRLRVFETAGKIDDRVDRLRSSSVSSRPARGSDSFAKPKSGILACRRCVTTMFDGLISR